MHEGILRRLRIGSAGEFDIPVLLAERRGRTRVGLAGTGMTGAWHAASLDCAPAGRTRPDLVLKRGAHRIDKVALQRIERERSGIEIKPVDRPMLVSRRYARKGFIECRREPVAAERD